MFSKNNLFEKLVLFCALLIFAAIILLFAIDYNSVDVDNSSGTVSLQYLTSSKQSTVTSSKTDTSDSTATSAPVTSKPQSSLININTATKDELDILPGIGPAKADAIVTYRETMGGFSSIEDIKNVKGIGEKTFENLKDYITVK